VLKKYVTYLVQYDYCKSLVLLVVGLLIVHMELSEVQYCHSRLYANFVCSAVNSFQVNISLYRVHIHALIPVYQINTVECVPVL